VATAAERLSSRDFADLSETELRLLEDLMRRSSRTAWTRSAT
jgi:hypothetical protein